MKQEAVALAVQALVFQVLAAAGQWQNRHHRCPCPSHQALQKLFRLRWQLEPHRKRSGLDGTSQVDG